MDSILNVLEVQILGNTLQRFIIALSVFLGLAIALKIFERFVIHRIKKSKFGHHGFPQFVAQVAEKAIMPLSYFAAFYFAVTQLYLNPSIARLVTSIMVIVLTIHVTRLGLNLAFFFIQELWIKKRHEADNQFISNSIMTIMRLAVWALAVIFILDNLGFNVSAVVAGLGIGGVAVALAAQTILGDLFNYFVIFFDRPFVTGDTINVNGFVATVEHIGDKTTRLRALSGEQLILSNSSLTSNSIQNYKRMFERRVVFTLNVVYQTPTDKLKKIPQIIRTIIEKAGQTRIDRIHFSAFASSSLDFETVYYFLSPDYNAYMDNKQKIYFEIKDAFEKEGIEFAYPTQTVYEFIAPNPNT
jgi:small-conductance mechanosensitive channel